MNGFQASLGPRQFGADILVHIARQRLSGTLCFGPPSKLRYVTFKEGRPEQTIDTQTNKSVDRAQIVQSVRAFAVSSAGRCTFSSDLDSLSGTAGIDTLGETLVAILQHLSSTQIDTFIAGRAALRVEVTASFAKLTQAIVQMGGEAVAPPPAGATLGSTMQQAEPTRQRVFAALLVLGGLRTQDWAVQLEAPPAGPAPSASPTTAMQQDIADAFRRMAEQDHYAFLGVARDAPAETIRKAYFELAKRWHADRLVGAGLDETSKEQAAELFRRAEEANRVLSNGDERSTYNWVIDRQAQGLPTDPKVVMEAESLFRRAETLVRRGQSGAAEPLLRQAVQLNKGEPEFWAYLGHAIYAVQGAAGLTEARECLDKALKMQEKMDVAYEFIGRIAHQEGDKAKAIKHLEQALQLNPQNTFAERELRLIVMRQDHAKPEKDRGLIGRLLKR